VTEARWLGADVARGSHGFLLGWSCARHL